MGPTGTFATDAVAKGSRLRFWNELADRYFTGTRVSTPEADFTGWLARWQVSDLGLTRLGSSASTVMRTPPAASEGNIVLHFQVRGRTSHTQMAVETRLSPGDYVLSSCRKPYCIRTGAHELLVAEFPRQPLMERVGSLDDRLGRLGHGAAPGAHLLRNYLLSLSALSQFSVGGSDWEEGACRSFYDLLALALQGGAEIGQRSPASARRERTLSLIEARLGDSDLSTAAIAAEMGISVRSLQMMFAEMGTTPSAYLLERRLRRSADCLISDASRTITDIAFDHGFGDSGYFSRCFHKRFGMPPSAWRRRDA